MKDIFPKEDQAQAVSAARIAMDRPEQEGFWDRLAEFFDERRAETEAVIQPRETREL